MRDHLLALAVHCHPAGEIEAGRRACEKLLAGELLPHEDLAVRALRTNYTTTLPNLATSARFVPFDIVPAHHGWTTFNPTLLYREDKLWAIVRSSNYRIVDGRYVTPEEDGGKIRTENILCRLTNGLDVDWYSVIAGPDYEATDYPVTGLEDCRLRETADGVGVSATVRNVAPFDGRCRIATAELDLGTPQFHSLHVIESAEAQTHEKNWMPLVGKAAWIHSANLDGFTVTVEESEDMAGEYHRLRRGRAPLVSREFRGGSQAVRFRGGWLACVHEVAVGPSNQRVYEHRLVWWDDSLRMAGISLPFAFRESQAIEFAAGIAVIGDRVVISFGVRDEEAWVVDIQEGEAWRMLTMAPGIPGRTSLR